MQQDEETLQCKMRTCSSRCRCLAGNSTRLGCRPCTLLADPQLTGYISAGTESLQELVWLGLRPELGLVLTGRLQVGRGSTASPKSSPPRASFCCQVIQSSLGRRRLPGTQMLSVSVDAVEDHRLGLARREEKHRLRGSEAGHSPSHKVSQNCGLLRALLSAELQSRDLRWSVT